MTVTLCKLNELKTYQYVVILAKHNDEWVLCKHKIHKSWEFPGGHIEEHEKPMDAAKRELREETGAAEFKIKPIFDFWVAENNEVSNVMAFFAEISKLGKLPNFEMEKISHYTELPAKLTYPEIMPKLTDQYQKLKLLGKI